MTAEKTDRQNPKSFLPTGKIGLSVTGKPDAPWLDGLLSRRLVFVMGKGGVGKTTISIALANYASRMNKKVLLVELGDTDSIGRLYYNQSLSAAPRNLTKNIWGARVDAKVELEDYVRNHVTPGFIAGKIIRSHLFGFLFEATPGLKEVMSLGRLWRWEKEAETMNRPAYDLIIVDAPATGHGMSLLRLPDILIKMIRVGPLARQINELQRLLKNRHKTCLVLVSLPEELPVNEAVEFHSMAKDNLGMPVAATFINCVYPDVFTPADLQQIEFFENKNENAFSTINNYIASARILNRRRNDQQKHIDEIHAKAGGHVHEIPFCFTNDLTIRQIRELSFFKPLHQVP